MGFLDRLFGADVAEAPVERRRAVRTVTRSADDRAIARYRYLLQTAPPETIEQVHAEAFAKLTDDQRAVIYEELSKGAGTGERPLSSEPATLARAATRAELRVPGSLERLFGAPTTPATDSPRIGSTIAGSLLSTVAGYVIGSALVSAFLPWDANSAGGSAADSDTDMSGSDVSGFGGGFESDFDGDVF
jgi:hypothetical protein